MQNNYSIIQRDNNFDLVRLFAAIQVVFFHVQDRLEILLPSMAWFRDLKGVPIFFTVSGFLISASYVRNRVLRQYFINRFLRIYPAIWMLIVVTTICALLTRDIGINTLFFEDYRHWIISWCTFDQNFTPPILYGFGIGTPNGSLWTIPVELTFYLFIPLLFIIRRKWITYIVIGFLYITSLVTNYMWHDFFATRPIISTFSFSLLPYLHYFILGTLMYLSWDKIHGWIENKFLYYFGAFMGLVICSEIFPQLGMHPEMSISSVRGVFMNILLALCTISAAFSFKNAAKVLRGNDLSYGIYLYHGLVINVIIEMTDNRSPWLYVLVYVLSIICAWFSWKYVEKPCLNLKNRVLTR